MRGLVAHARARDRGALRGPVLVSDRATAIRSESAASCAISTPRRRTRATRHTDYPDSVVQIARLAGSERAGDLILSASRDWDFRARYEPIPHVSSHGALHREHMIVPLLLDRPPSRTPRRTTDVMPSALDALGLAIPPGLDGESFL